MSETSIASARASVMIYDDISKKWIPSGTSSGLSKVHIFKHVVNNTFRVVGRKLQDHESMFIPVPGVDDQCQTMQIEVVTQGDVPGEITGDTILEQLVYNQEQDNGNVQIQLQQENDVSNYQILNSSNNDAIESFSSLQEVNTNNIIHEPVVPECQNHGKKYIYVFYLSQRKSALNKHTANHSGIKTQICQDCGKGFYFPYELKRHSKIHDKKTTSGNMENLEKSGKTWNSQGNL